MVDTTDEKTFVYEGKEWTLTGRKAAKPVFHKRRVNEVVGSMTVVEIAPTGIAGGDPTFHKWVDPRELFYISEVKNLDVESLKKSNDEASRENN
jgi:hypothetical protein